MRGDDDEGGGGHGDAFDPFGEKRTRSQRTLGRNGWSTEKRLTRADGSLMTRIQHVSQRYKDHAT